MLRVGLIGAGNISRAHLFSYNRNQEVEVAAIADLNETLVKERAEAFGVQKYYTDYRELLKDKTIEAVSILTPTFAHHQVVIEALYLMGYPKAKMIVGFTTDANHDLPKKSKALEMGAISLIENMDNYMMESHPVITSDVKK